MSRTIKTVKRGTHSNFSFSKKPIQTRFNRTERRKVRHSLAIEGSVESKDLRLIMHREMGWWLS